MAQNRKGGGLGTRHQREVGVRTGQPRQGKNVRAVSQIGSSFGNHSTEHSGLLPRDKVIEKMAAGPGTPSRLGNEVALNVGRGGVGTGRTVYRPGTQGVHGPVNPGNPRPVGELLPGWPAKGR